METTIRFLRRHPPRTGWQLFTFALATVLILPVMVSASSLELQTTPTVIGVIAGLIVGFGGGRRTRPLLIIPALLVCLALIGLLPPWRVIESDLWALGRIVSQVVRRSTAPYPPLLFAAAVSAAATSTQNLLVAAWEGNAAALAWFVAHLLALLGFLSAGMLGLGLRRRALLLTWTMPLIATIVLTVIIARLGLGYAITGLFVTMLFAIFGSFISRERSWERAGTGYSDILRWDVAQGGTLLLALVIGAGFVLPSLPRNFVTTWLWADVRLPAGLEELDNDAPGTRLNGNLGGGRSQVGRMRAGDDLALGQSLEQGARDEMALRIQVQGVPEGPLPYWRAQIFEDYTGRGWETGEIRMVPIGSFQIERDPANFTVQQITDMNAGRGRSPRYGLPDIIATGDQALREETALGELVGWSGTTSSYTVYSQPPVRPSDTIPELVRMQSVLVPFRELPDALPERVADLARRITEAAVSQTERAAAIESYLRDLSYSYEVEPLQPGGDAVDQFLFTMRSGYCTYYASAMAVMARVVGIPSRVAVGYASGTLDPETRTYTVLEADAHAWPELYIDGQGWTRWEPTPIREVPPRNTSPEIEPIIPESEPAQPVAQSNYWGILILGVAAMLLAVVAWQRLNFVAPLSPAGVHTDLYRFGRRVGVPPGAGDTVEDYTRRLARAAPAAERPLTRVGRLLTARIYRDQPLAADEEHNLITDWHIVRDILRRKPDERK